MVDNCYFEIMDVIYSVNVEKFLSSFEGDTISDLWANHHLDAIHVIFHDVFKLDLQSVFIH